MLINSTPALQNYTTVSADLDFDLIKPNVRMAEKRFIIPVLGYKFYQELNKAVLESSSKYDLLIDLINCVTAPLAVWYYSQMGAATVDSSGIYKPRNEQRWNLSDREQKQLETTYLTAGIDALDDLLGYLYEHAADFPTYEDSHEYLFDTSSTLVPTGKAIETVFTLLHPRVTFRALKESISFVEHSQIKDVMQSYHELLVRKKEIDLNEVDKLIKPVAQRALIYLAMSRALITRTVTLTAEGVEVVIREGKGSISEFENPRIEAAAKEYERSGEQELARLAGLLRKHLPDGFTYVLPVPKIDDGKPKSVFFL